MWSYDLVLHVLFFAEMVSVDTESLGILSQDEVDRQNMKLLENPSTKQPPAEEPEPEPEQAVPSAEDIVEAGTKCFDLV